MFYMKGIVGGLVLAAITCLALMLPGSARSDVPVTVPPRLSSTIAVGTRVAVRDITADRWVLILVDDAKMRELDARRLPQLGLFTVAALGSDFIELRPTAPERDTILLPFSSILRVHRPNPQQAP
jgi:hypothetical protein